jgi:hypothetical protein
MGTAILMDLLGFVEGRVPFYLRRYDVVAEGDCSAPGLVHKELQWRYNGVRTRQGSLRTLKFYAAKLL